MWLHSALSSKLDTEISNYYAKIDLTVVSLASLINVMMAGLFAARMSGLSQMRHALGIAAMVTGFALGYMAFLTGRESEKFYLAGVKFCPKPKMGYCCLS